MIDCDNSDWVNLAHSITENITVTDGPHSIGDTPEVTVNFLNTGSENIDSLTVELIHPNPPCVIVDVDVVPESTITEITWTIRDTDTGQDKVGTGQICYGTDPENLDLLGPNENTFIYSTHIQKLTPLEPNTLYYYEIKSIDQNGFLTTFTGNFLTS